MLGKRGAVGTFVLAAGLVIAPVSETPAAADTTTGTSAQIVTPTAGSAVTGLVDVEATGQVDPTDGFAQSMQLLVDGTALPQSYGCSNPASPGNTTSPYSCQVVIPWDATGLSGSHTLQAALTTNVNTVDSPSVTVTVNNPRPTVALDSPAPGVVAGLVALKASGSLPGGQTDVVQQIQYWIDGALVSTLACINPECPTTYYWNTVGHTGAHTVEVKLLTRNGSVAAGPVENFQVVRPIQVTVDFPNAVTAGTSTSITGHVTATDIDSPAAGVTVKVTFTPATGSPSTVATTTAANGTFRVSYTPRTKTTISATVIGTNVWQASSTDMTTLLQVDAVVPCALSHSTVQHGRSDTLTCQASGMPSGTRADVQERVSAGKWVLLTAAGHFSGGKVKYTFTLKKKGSYTLAVLIGNNTVYSGGYGQTHVKVT